MRLWGICYLRILRQELHPLGCRLNVLFELASGKRTRSSMYNVSSERGHLLWIVSKRCRSHVSNKVSHWKIAVSNNYFCRYCNKSVVRFLALSRPRSGSETSSSTSSTSSSTNSTPSPCPPSLPQDVQNRVAVEEVLPPKNFWIGNRTTWTKLLFPGGPCPHWPPGSVGRCRLHREVSHFFSA